MIISSNNFPVNFYQSSITPKIQIANSQERAVTTVSAKGQSCEECSEGQQADKENTSANNPDNKNKIKNELDQQEISQLRELRQRDREVRAHEQAHAAVAGSLAKGGPSFSYQRGPDGQLYAIGGEVQIDTSTVAGDPQATAEKAQQVRHAALAPAQPSQQDRAVAARAAAVEAQARVEISQQKTEDGVDIVNNRFSHEQNSVENGESNKVKESANSEVQSKCAHCGGQHSAESHTVSIALNATFNQTEQSGQKESQFDIAI